MITVLDSPQQGLYAVMVQYEIKKIDLIICQAKYTCIGPFIFALLLSFMLKESGITDTVL